MTIRWPFLRLDMVSCKGGDTIDTRSNIHAWKGGVLQVIEALVGSY